MMRVLSSAIHPEIILFVRLVISQKNKRMKSIDDDGMTEKNTTGPHLYCSLCIRPTPLPRIIAYVTHEL